nr:Chain B, DNA polymerase kappa [Mus musculus]
SFFDKKRSER